MRRLPRSRGSCPTLGDKGEVAEVHEIVLSKVGDKLLDHFAGKVIRRWSQWRAKRFFRALVEGLSEGAIDEQDALERIDRALEDEAKSEALFDAYRRVCLSASRDSGPKLIGLLTARILSEGRTTANEVEEKLFMAAERLSDSEFKAFLEFFREAAMHRSGQITEAGRILVKSHSEQEDSKYSGAKIDISPLDLGESYGLWALKAASAGILSQQMIREKQHHKEDSERYIDMDGVVTDFSWFVGFDAALLEYIDLIALSAQEVT